MKRSTRTIILLSILILLLAATGGFVAWAETPLGPMPEALAALQSDAQVQVSTAPWMVFTPAGQQPETGFIFYPGGRVDPRSYAPQARLIAAQGYVVVIPPMTLNLAVFSSNEAAQVIAAYPQVKHWAIGGHSLGGAMAASYARKHPDQIEGLVFWASYPASSDDLSGQAIKVASIYGTVDGLSTGGKIDASRPLLPADTTWVAIQGGNHAGFGWYGPQPGDGSATISHEEQQAQTVAATVALLAQLGK